MTPLSKSHVGAQECLDSTWASCIQGIWIFRIESKVARPRAAGTRDRPEPFLCSQGMQATQARCRRARLASSLLPCRCEPQPPGQALFRNRGLIHRAADEIRPDRRRGRIGSVPERATEILRTEFDQQVLRLFSSYRPSTGMPCLHLTCEVTGHKVWSHEQDQRI